MQPTVVIIGDLMKPSAAYVVVDKVEWGISTALKAVDIAFKCFHVLHASYPSESMVWLVIQQLVYDITTKWDAKCSAVATLVNDLKRKLAK